jgi:uncharacterized protein (TIGR00369 family)
LTQDQIAALSDTAAFNRWAGFKVVKAEGGNAVLEMPWRADFGQYAGFLHAGLISALLDTVCGFAAVSTAGPVMTSQMSVSFLSPAIGDVFSAEATITKSGRRQVFADAKLIAVKGLARSTVATATAVMIRIETENRGF